MPSTRSQRAPLASPLATTTRSRRSASRALSAEPAALPKAPSSGEVSPALDEERATTKRKVVVVEEEAAQPPKKRRNALKDSLFREKIAKRVQERREERFIAAQEEAAPPSPLPPRRMPPPYPVDGYTPPANFTRPTQPKGMYAQFLTPRPVAATTSATTTTATPEAPQTAPHQQQPEPARGFFNRFLDTVSPFRRRSQAPAGKNEKLLDARIDLVQLQQHVKTQAQLNQEIARTLHREEQNSAAAAPQNEMEQHARAGDKRKRSAANMITNLAPLDDISESPEITRTNMKTPSKASEPANTGLVPKSLPRRRTREEAKAARALAAAKGMRTADGPSTPAVSRTTTITPGRFGPPSNLFGTTPNASAASHTAPTTPYDKNNYARIRRTHEIEQLVADEKSMKEKLARLRKEQEDEEERLRPRKTKRVKLDHLKEVPHNRPGEADGCFRFPEIDSDDEMEVDQDVELVDNAFNTHEENTPKASPAVKTPKPAAKPSTKTSTPSASLFSKPSQAKPLTSFTPAPVQSTETAPPQRPQGKLASLEKVKVVDVVEIEEDQAGEKDSTASPEPARVFSDSESVSGSEIDLDVWPPLPLKKQGEMSPSAAWKEECEQMLVDEVEHWIWAGEIAAV